MSERSMSGAGRAPERRPVLTLADLTEDLLWPRLLSAPALALRPGCVGIALFTLVAIWLVGSLSALWSDGENLVAALYEGKVEGFRGLLSGVLSLDPVAAGSAARETLVVGPMGFLGEHWVSLLVLGPVIVAVWGVGGCAISRSAARDSAMRLSTPWPRALAFALDRWWASLLALAGPLVFVGGIALALMVAGWALYSLPVLDVVGGLLYPLVLLGGALGAAILIGYVFGAPMLVPAVACEGTDGIDAIQRALAYVLGRPLRLVVYLVILIVQGVVVFTVLALIAGGAIALAQGAAGALSGAHGAVVLAGEGEASGTAAVARFLVQLVNGVVWLGVVAFAVSYYFAGSTVLYLLMRELNDGQSCEDLWVPGMIEGVMARAERGAPARAGDSPLAGPATPGAGAEA